MEVNAKRRDDLAKDFEPVLEVKQDQDFKTHRARGPFRDI